MLKTTKIIKRVAFFGDGLAKNTEQHYIDAYNTAKLLAENGYIIVNGGGPGVMLASTLGAKAERGKVEIVVLDPIKDPANYEKTDQKNFELADKKIITETYSGRINKLVEIADAFVIFKGGTGTLAEVGIVWSLAKFDHGHHEPLIFFGKEWEKTVKEMVNDLKFEKMERDVYTIVEKPEEVLEQLYNR